MEAGAGLRPIRHLAVRTIVVAGVIGFHGESDRKKRDPEGADTIGKLQPDIGKQSCRMTQLPGQNLKSAAIEQGLPVRRAYHPLGALRSTRSPAGLRTRPPPVRNNAQSLAVETPGMRGFPLGWHSQRLDL